MEVLRTRLCEWSPIGIEALALSPPEEGNLSETGVAPCRLAVGRSNGSIELWDTNTWHLRCSSPGRARRSIRSIVWVVEPSEDPKAPPKRRLISAGLHREITEWDVETMSPLESVASGGGAVWCLRVLGQRIFAACDDGSVRVFSLEGGPGSLVYQQRVNVSKTRLLSLATAGAAGNPKEQYFFAGGSDSRISKWSVQSSVCEGNMQVEQARKDVPTLVWSLASINDQTLASGDSLGLVQIWDTVACVMLHRFAQHQADVLALAASEDGLSLLSGGLDTKIACFSLQRGQQERWVFSDSQFCHTHDIKALAVQGHATGPENQRLFVSGGLAGALFAHVPWRGGKHARKSAEPGAGDGAQNPRPLQCSSFSPFFQTAAVAQASRLLLCQKETHFELWYLSEQKEAAELGDDVEEKQASLPESQLLLKVKLSSNGDNSTSAGSGDHLCSTAISADGALIAASDMTGTRLFRLTLGDLEVRRERGLPLDVQKIPARSLLFCGAGLLAVAPWNSRSLLLVDCNQFFVAARFDEEHNAPLSLLAAGGPGGEWLAAADLAGAVHIYSLDGLHHHVQVPIGAANGVPTALGFDGPGKILIVVTDKHAVLFYDVEAQTLVAGLPSPAIIPKKILSPQARVCGIAAPSKEPGKLLLWGHSFMVALTLTPGATATDGNGNESKEDGPCFWRPYGGYKHILALTALDEAKWGSPISSEQDRKSLAEQPRKKKRKSSSGAAVPGGAAMVLSFEVSPEAALKSLPTAFERKQYKK
eukprot:TRINITY_DN5015_c1_g1_i1.p1 TRINITY_DN5015_c1_g1~~TRINITY_DN5015_c1_g1_i1.p1  ORF type:complete len:762 (+),score=126.61 TRINITY_DN5015_c1_g1_i1:185-2470(+)